MRIRKPGRVHEHLWYLGSEESSLYVLEGKKESMLIGGGMSYLVPELLRQFGEFGIDEGRITKQLILHAHFDHVGIVPFFKRRRPGMEVYASERGWEILRMPKAVRTINEFSRSVANRMGKEGVFSTYDLDWRDDVTGQAVREGTRIDLGDVSVLILEVPGHSSCSIAAYVPEVKTLFPSDGGGIPFKESILPSGNSDFTQYQKSLEKLKDLDVAYLCADHYGYITGEEAKRFIGMTIDAAKNQRSVIEKAFSETRDVNETARKLTSLFFGRCPDYFLSAEIMQAVFGQMVRHISKGMETKSSS